MKQYQYLVLDVDITVSFYITEKCLPGTYYAFPSNTNAGINQGTCNSCAVGYYQDTLGSINCKPCSVDLTTAGVGTSSIAGCVSKYDRIRYYCNKKVCKEGEI